VPAPIISPAADNQVSCTPQGLYVPRSPVQRTSTSCISLSGDGIPGNPLQADPIISPAAGNQVSCTPQGMFVPEPTIDTQDTSCINLTGDGSSASPLQADPVISPDPTNALQCTALGLYAPAAAPAPVSTQDTSCVDLSGNGSPATPLQADLIIDPSAANLAQCGPSGLGAFLSHQDTNSIDLNGAGTAGSPLTADIRIRPSHPGFGVGCNGIFVDAAGVSVAPPPTVRLASASAGGGGGVFGPGFYGFSIAQFILINTNPCIAMAVKGEARSIWNTQYFDDTECAFQISMLSPFAGVEQVVDRHISLPAHSQSQQVNVLLTFDFLIPPLAATLFSAQATLGVTSGVVVVYSHVANMGVIGVSQVP